MSNPNQAMLEKLLNDPKLLKELSNLAKQANVERSRKKVTRNDSIPSYINRITSRCTCCSSELLTYVRMDFSLDSKMYHSGGSAWDLPVEWLSLPIKDLVQRQPSCKMCQTKLREMSQDELIAIIHRLTNKLYRRD